MTAALCRVGRANGGGHESSGGLRQPAVTIPLAQNKFDDKGNLTNEPTRKFISDMPVALVAWTNRVGAKK